MSGRGRRRVMGLAAAGWLWAAQAGAQTVEYYHLDALGSVRVVTNEAGAAVRRHDYLPFGQEWAGTPGEASPKMFTGQERDVETGLDYFGARYYQAEIGRFTTVDPGHVGGDVGDPQSWNGYAYAGNNPLRNIDPDGRNPLLIGGGIGAVVYGGWAVYQNVSHGRPPLSGNVGFEAAKGFAVGATLGLAAPALAAADVTVGVGSANLALDAAASNALRVDPSTVLNDANKLSHLFQEGHQLELLGTKGEALGKIADAVQKAYAAGARSMNKSGVFGQDPARGGAEGVHPRARD